MALAGVSPSNRRSRLLCLGCGFYLLPLLHPVTLAAGACICMVLAWQTRFDGKRDWSIFTSAFLGYTCGGLTLFLWFYLQPEAWLQFTDHAASVRASYSGENSVWRALQILYYPTFTGHLLWITSLFVSLATLYAWIKNRRVTNAIGFWGAAIFISCLVIHEEFNNESYLALYFPEAAILALLLASQLAQRAAFANGHHIVRILLCFFIVGHGLFWATRTLKFLQSGRPHLREELTQIATNLPHDRHVLIPDVLWEAALSDPSRFAMNTLPQHASRQRRQAYEALVYGNLSTGDLVIVDRLQIMKPIYVLPQAGWEMVRRYEHLLPGRLEWGYDFTIWRKD
jgi:hypothetical protein